MAKIVNSLKDCRFFLPISNIAGETLRKEGSEKIGGRRKLERERKTERKPKNKDKKKKRKKYCTVNSRGKQRQEKERKNVKLITSRPNSCRPFPSFQSGILQ